MSCSRELLSRTAPASCSREFLKEVVKYDHFLANAETKYVMSNIWNETTFERKIQYFKKYAGARACNC